MEEPRIAPRFSFANSRADTCARRVRSSRGSARLNGDPELTEISPSAAGEDGPVGGEIGVEFDGLRRFREPWPCPRGEPASAGRRGGGRDHAREKASTALRSYLKRIDPKSPRKSRQRNQ